MPAGETETFGSPAWLPVRRFGESIWVGRGVSGALTAVSQVSLDVGLIGCVGPLPDCPSPGLVKPPKVLVAPTSTTVISPAPLRTMGDWVRALEEPQMAHRTPMAKRLVAIATSNVPVIKKVVDSCTAAQSRVAVASQIGPICILTKCESHTSVPYWFDQDPGP